MWTWINNHTHTHTHRSVSHSLHQFVLQRKHRKFTGPNHHSFDRSKREKRENENKKKSKNAKITNEHIAQHRWWWMALWIACNNMIATLNLRANKVHKIVHLKAIALHCSLHLLLPSARTLSHSKNWSQSYDRILCAYVYASRSI